jgi:hypothetical protein
MHAVREAVLKFPVPAGVREVPALPEGCFVRQRDVLPFEALRNARVTVIGAGAVGSFTTLSLVKMGVGTVEVYDHDSVAVENLSAQWFRVADLGRPKVEALEDQLAAFGGTVVPHAQRFLAQPVSGIVVCAVDSMDVRVSIWHHVRKCRRVELYVDARMGAEVGKVFAIRPQDPEDRRAYEADLYPSTEALRAPCTARSTIYCAAGLAAFLAATVGNFLSGRRYRRELVVDFRMGLVV